MTVWWIYSKICRIIVEAGADNQLNWFLSPPVSFWCWRSYFLLWETTLDLSFVCKMEALWLCDIQGRNTCLNFGLCDKVYLFAIKKKTNNSLNHFLQLNTYFKPDAFLKTLCIICQSHTQGSLVLELLLPENTRAGMWWKLNLTQDCLTF